MEMPGIEPRASRMQNRHATTEPLTRCIVCLKPKPNTNPDHRETTVLDRSFSS